LNKAADVTDGPSATVISSILFFFQQAGTNGKFEAWNAQKAIGGTPAEYVGRHFTEDQVLDETTVRSNTITPTWTWSYDGETGTGDEPDADSFDFDATKSSMVVSGTGNILWTTEVVLKRTFATSASASKELTAIVATYLKAVGTSRDDMPEELIKSDTLIIKVNTTPVPDPVPDSATGTSAFFSVMAATAAVLLF
jgi:hypothetical protein